MKISKLKVGDQLLTWTNKKVTIVAIRADKYLKPLVVEYNGRVQYYHYDQIIEVI